MNRIPTFALLLVSATMVAQLPNGAKSPGAASSTGTGEIERIAKAYDNPPEDVKHLQTLLPDWARLAYYTEGNARLAGKKVDVVFLGDSITHNWADKKYSTFMQDHGYVGRGIGGQITAQMLLRMQQDVIALNPKVVVLLGGTNDISVINVPNKLKSIEDNITMIADLAAAHHERLILTSVMPINDDHQKRSVTRPPEEILALNTWMRDFAKERKLHYVDYYAALTDGHDRMKSDLTADGLHPNAGGYKLIEPLVQRAIEQDLKK